MSFLRIDSISDCIRARAQKPDFNLYVIGIQRILGKLPVVPVCDTGTIHHPRNLFPVHPLTEVLVPAMDAGCGFFSTRGP